MAAPKKDEKYQFAFYGFKCEIPGKYYLGIFITLIILISIVFLGSLFLLGKYALPVAGASALGNGIMNFISKLTKVRSP